MAERIDAEDEAARLEMYVERLAAMQSTVADLNREMNLVRQDARINGINLDALNFVVSLRSRFPDNLGSPVIDEVISYADISGVDFERNPIRIAEMQEPTASNQTPTAQEQYAHEYIEEDEEKQSGFVNQILVGLGITILMLWLLT